MSLVTGTKDGDWARSIPEATRKGTSGVLIASVDYTSRMVVILVERKNSAANGAQG
jgi:hypothetical protein